MTNKSFKLGRFDFTNGVILAPMAGVTDRSFRTVCRRFGADYTVSEMISAKALHYKDKKTDTLAAVFEPEAPVVLQIFGSEPETMAEAAYELSRTPRGGVLPIAIDINMGCPVKKIVCGGDGSALMRKPALAAKIIRAVCDASALPVTVKIRSGWCAEEINATKIAKIAEENGAAAVCVHGRTRAQMYMPSCDINVIKDVKNAVSIPVVGNGDICCGEDAKRMLEYTGCDAVMVGRASLGNPWIFREISAFLQGREFSAPSFSERLAVAKEHMSLLAEEKGDRVGLFESRKHIAWYVKALPGAAEFRGAVNNCSSWDELWSLLSEYEQKLSEVR